MFKKDQATREPAAEPSNRVDSLIGQGTVFTGEIHFQGGMHVDGRVQGSVRAEDNASALLTVSEHGCVEGEVQVPHLHVNGTLKGNVHCSEKLVVLENARIDGDVRYRLLEIAVGAQINGRLIHLDGETHDASAGPIRQTQSEGENGDE